MSREAAVDRKVYQVTVSYPAARYPDGDTLIERLRLGCETDTGMGFGQRDLFLMFPTFAAAHRARQKLRAEIFPFTVAQQITYFDGRQWLEVKE